MGKLLLQYSFFVCVSTTICLFQCTSKKILLLIYCLIILLSPYSSFRWERSAQFLVLYQAIRGTSGHFMSTVFMTPLIMYAIFALLVEALQYHHRKKTRRMFETWSLIEKARERSDIKALFYVLLTKDNLDADKKILGEAWSTALISPLLPAKEQ